jgi:hypothetical protein
VIEERGSNTWKKQFEVTFQKINRLKMNLNDGYTEMRKGIVKTNRNINRNTYI